MKFEIRAKGAPIKRSILIKNRRQEPYLEQTLMAH